MNNEQNENLCKLLGIKPTEEREPARMEDADGELCAWYINYIYPDLSAPSNFVKLLELIIKEYEIIVSDVSISIEGFYSYSKGTLQERTIKAIYEFLKEQFEEAEEDGQPDYYNDFKQQAQQTQWDY